MSIDDPDSGPRIRRAAIPADAWLVVRGLASIEPETSIRQAELFLRRFPEWGRYGLSAFYARSDDEVLDLGEDRLNAFEHSSSIEPSISSKADSKSFQRTEALT